MVRCGSVDYDGLDGCSSGLLEHGSCYDSLERSVATRKARGWKWATIDCDLYYQKRAEDSSCYPEKQRRCFQAFFYEVVSDI